MKLGIKTTTYFDQVCLSEFNFNFAVCLIKRQVT
jgi:hypothetical protein